MSLADVNTYFIILFLFVSILLPIMYAFSEAHTVLTPIFGAGSQADLFMTNIYTIYGWLDYAMLFFYVGTLTGSIILAWFVKTHPVFYIFFMIGSFFMVFLSWIFKNVLEEFVNSSVSFVALYNQFPFTQYMVVYSPLMVLGASVVIAIIQYSEVFQ